MKRRAPKRPVSDAALLKRAAREAAEWQREVAAEEEFRAEVPHPTDAEVVKVRARAQRQKKARTQKPPTPVVATARPPAVRWGPPAQATGLPPYPRGIPVASTPDPDAWELAAKIQASVYGTKGSIPPPPPPPAPGAWRYVKKGNHPGTAPQQPHA